MDIWLICGLLGEEITVDMRLDSYLVNKGLCRSRERAKEIIKKGFCKVNEEVVCKASKQIEANDNVLLIKSDYQFVGRGGLKLEKALDEFGIEVAGKFVLDVGAATGGFTDCLLKRGAKMVYALDIGEGQLVEELKSSNRVVFINNTDIRKVEPRVFEADIDLTVVDVSFISLKDILSNLLFIADEKKCREFVFLIKPQYETGRKHSGVIRDKSLIRKILKDLRMVFANHNLEIAGEIESPIKGKEGNTEFLWHVRRN